MAARERRGRAGRALEEMTPYLLFFLSGATALIYQVVWVRSLTLVFGGSHQAVTAVLAIFMAGLALGGALIGRGVDRVRRPLRLYGLLELGIAASALGVVGLLQIYPSIYVPLARDRDDSILYLSALRALFAAVALLVPTTLMGGTLPVLARFVAGGPETLRRSLALLYGLNTLGAVLGTLLASFVLLRLYPVSLTLGLAIAANVAIGIASLALQPGLSGPGRPVAAAAVPRAAPAAPAGEHALARRLVLWGIGVSGFCALGYEVLWTRILTLAIGASVYGFTIMLAAFLAGIALGSKACGLLRGRGGGAAASPARAIAWFGAVQVAIGVAALGVTVQLRDVPLNTIRLQELVLRPGVDAFAGRVWASFALAFLHMLVPACLMGAAFPLAGEIHARSRQAVGRAVGEVLAWNTVGAILGAATSGFALIYLFGIERSLQLLAVLNAGTGLVVLAALGRHRLGVALGAAATAAALGLLAANPGLLRLWDPRTLAIFRANQPDLFSTREKLQEALDNTEVLYYAEGAEAIVSVVRIRGGEQSFITNGRVEASTHPSGRQHLLTLGHLPMLLAREPRRVLVVGTGSGMTLGATSVHPEVERITLAEIEPRVMGVARTFAAHNHAALDSPRLRVVFNDGRNFLLTTRERFDVITADPIHPWFRGAGYLYTTQYFALVAARLRPGGVVAQWLPIYELTPDDLRSIVRTFQQHFRHTLLWLTGPDAELIGSNEPLLIDEAALERRIARTPAVAGDLRSVTMGSAADLLGYFVMGTEGMARFGRGAVLNTDDRLYLEFSAPFSIASPALTEANVRALTAHRESLLPYLRPAEDPRAREEQLQRAEAQRQAGQAGDLALALFLGGKASSLEFARAMEQLARRHPAHAPGRFLAEEHQAAMALRPRPLDAVVLPLSGPRGERLAVEITAVLVPVSRSRAAVMFVDNRSRTVYGQRYVDDYEGTEIVGRLVARVLAAVRAAHEQEASVALARQRPAPPVERTLDRVRQAIEAGLLDDAPRAPSRP